MLSLFYRNRVGVYMNRFLIKLILAYSVVIVVVVETSKFAGA